MKTALGALEIFSIPKGIEAGDAMLKAANVELVSASTVCAGKYVVVIHGAVDAVKASVDAGVQVGGSKVIDSLVIPNIDPQVPKAIVACSDVGDVAAVGTIELFSVCSAIAAADAAVKAARVQLIEVRLGRGLGGKSFLVLTGDVSSVKAATQAAGEAETSEGLVSDITVIPSPHPDLVRALL